MKEGFYFNGYTFEEFEKVYGENPYFYVCGVKLFRDDLEWFAPDRIDISVYKQKRLEAELNGYDVEHLFETEDEHFMRKQREEEERREKIREKRREERHNSHY